MAQSCLLDKWYQLHPYPEGFPSDDGCSVSKSVVLKGATLRHKCMEDSATAVNRRRPPVQVMLSDSSKFSFLSSFSYENGEGIVCLWVALIEAAKGTAR